MKLLLTTPELYLINIRNISHFLSNNMKIIVLHLLLFTCFINSNNAQYTAIPDTSFEQALINQSIDSENLMDGQVLTSDISGLTTLTISFTTMTIHELQKVSKLVCGSI